MSIKIKIRKTYVEKRIMRDEDENEQNFGASMLVIRTVAKEKATGLSDGSNRIERRKKKRRIPN